ncbi:MAG TPA: hypothetical protein VK432_01090 [Stellaceae bacterium]|nr:hypothetical protein [Stellaceae bacterium]
MHEIARRAELCGATHPGHYDLRPRARDLAAKSEPGRDIQAMPKAELGDRDPRVAQVARAIGIAADHKALIFASARQRRRQPNEKNLGPTMLFSGYGLKQASLHRPSTAGGGAATLRYCPLRQMFVTFRYSLSIVA